MKSFNFSILYVINAEKFIMPIYSVEGTSMLQHFNLLNIPYFSWLAILPLLHSSLQL